MLGQSGNDAVRAHQSSFWNRPSQPGMARPDEGRVHSNLFLAIIPDTAAALQSADIGRRLARANGLSHGPRPFELLHVTLNPIGSYIDLSEADVFAVSAMMSSIQAAPFEINFDRAVSFSGGGERHPLVLCNAIRSEELMDLHVQLAKEMWGAGMTFTYNPRFMPHMTLAYDEVSVAETELAEPVRWMVREVVLVHSHVGRSHHEYLGRWQLSDGQARRSMG